MTVLNGILSTIIYSPLIIIGLLIIYAIAYGLWHYKTTGDIPETYSTTFSIIKYVLIKLLLPLKMLGQFFWWLLPIFPEKYREPMGYVKYGAWDRVNIARSGLLLTLIGFITTTILIYNYGYPNMLVSWSKYLNISLLVLGIALTLFLFISFNKGIMAGEGGPSFPTGGSLSEKNTWLFRRGGRLLSVSIGVGLILAVLGILCYLVARYSFFTLTGTTILMILGALAILFIAYNMLKTNTKFSNILKNNSLLNILFYSVFIIPCLFTDTIKFLYNILRHTPRIGYILLGIEILVVILYVVIPIFQKYMYTLMPGKNKSLLLKRKISREKTIIEILKKKISDIKNMHPLKGKKIDERGWNNIISNNLNNSSNIEELRSFLINYGYTTKDMCSQNPLIKNKDACAETIKIMIKQIQKETIHLIRYKSQLSDAELYINDLENQLRQVTKFEKGKVLLMNPIYLKNKRTLGSHDNFRFDKDDIEYNYNYGISAWFFIRAQPANFKQSYNKFTSILNYGDKPNILYYAAKNTLRIEMNNGKNKKPIIYEIETFPLQKWNNIVVNYDGGILDIFINAKLVASITNVVPYMNMDQLTVGSDDGVGGGVCNVVYFPLPMSKERIDINYRLLKNKNPPVI